MDSLQNSVRAFCRLCDWIARAGVFAMLVLVVVSVALRKLGMPLYGAYDYVGFLGALTVAFALAHCAVERGHTQVEMLVERLPRRAQGVIDSLAGVLALALFAVVTWQCLALAEDMRRSGEVSMTAQVPFYPYIYGVAFGFALLCVVILLQCVNSLGKAVKG
ncbi:MAG: TRAP transporter small permease [Deltaproteobacteria bacterium]|nr:TRAP transporter small permease [Deltaproteobacteria bacterium]